MSVTVIPLTDAERDAHRCAYCSKHLVPSKYRGHRHFIYQALKGETCAAQLAAYQTNRRVIAVRRSWRDETDAHFEKTGRRVVTGIDIQFMPDDDRDWGYDGLFCTVEHGRLFAHACYRAGWRMKAKVTS